jgi:hypothetical protein
VKRKLRLRFKRHKGKRRDTTTVRETKFDDANSPSLVHIHEVHNKFFFCTKNKKEIQIQKLKVEITKKLERNFKTKKFQDKEISRQRNFKTKKFQDPNPF